MVYTAINNIEKPSKEGLACTGIKANEAVHETNMDVSHLLCSCCPIDAKQNLNDSWQILKKGASAITRTGGFMTNHITKSIQEEPCYTASLATTMAAQIADRGVNYRDLRNCFFNIFKKYPNLVIASMDDLFSYVEKDPACNEMAQAMLFFKGFHAIQTQRLANRYWLDGNEAEAYWLQNRASVLFGVDIHPAARLGSGLFVDHATGIVIGETVEIGDNVSLFHGVTLGGTGQETGDRHPKVGSGVTVGANATLLGNISIGNNSIIGASTVVLKSVEPNSRVVGNPARTLTSQ